MRVDGRANDELRPISFERNFTDQTPGSVLVSFGRTKVLCTVSIDDDVPRWMRGNGEGWVTAEYAMLPGSSGERVGRKQKRKTERPHPRNRATYRQSTASRLRHENAWRARSDSGL